MFSVKQTSHHVGEFIGRLLNYELQCWSIVAIALKQKCVCVCVCVCVRARLHACQSRLRCNFTLSGTNTLTSSQETITFWNSEHDSAKYRVLPTPFLTLLAALSGLPHITRVMVGNRCIEKPYCAYEQSYDRLASLCRWTIIWHASSTGIKPLVFRCMHLVFLITGMNSMHIWFVYEIDTWKDKWNSFVLEFLLSAVICCSSWWSIATAVPLYDLLKWGIEIVLLDASCLVCLCSARSRLL